MQNQKKQREKKNLINYLTGNHRYRNRVHFFIFDKLQQVIMRAYVNQLGDLVEESEFNLLLNQMVSNFENILFLVIDTQQPLVNPDSNLTPPHNQKVLGKIHLNRSSNQDPISSILFFLKKQITKRPELFFKSSIVSLRQLFFERNNTKKLPALNGPVTNSGHLSNLPSRYNASFYDNLPAISRSPRNETIPLSDGQYRLVYLEERNSEFSSYNWLMSFLIEDDLNIAALEKSIQHLIKRHESLRTGLDLERKCQIIIPAAHINWSIEYEQVTERVELKDFLKYQNGSYAKKKFNLKHPPLIRSKVIELQTNEKKLFLFKCVIHHAVTDGSSQANFLKELAACYKFFAVGNSKKKLLLDDLPLQYADYCLWLENKFPATWKKQQLNFWKEQLKDVQPLELPIDFPRPSAQTFKGDRVLFSIPKNIANELRHLSIKQKTTLFVVLLTSFQCLLYRYSGQEDFCVGTVTANRKKGRIIQQQLSNIIGFLANSIPIRTKIESNQLIGDLISLTKQSVENSIYRNSDVTFGEIVNAVNPTFDSSQNPIFNTMFILQPQGYQELNLFKTKSKPVETGWNTSRFDLALEFRETSEGLSGFFEFNSDLFMKESIERLADNYKTLLSHFSSEKTKIFELPIISKLENELLQSFNKSVSYNQELCVHEIFEQHALNHPDKIALCFDKTTLTYKNLNEQANQFAHNLLNYDLDANSIVGICLERSIEAEIALIGTLKAGHALVFFETNIEELGTVQKKIATIKPRVLISAKHTPIISQLSQNLASLTDNQTRIILWEEFARENSKQNPVKEVSVDDSALISLTSGTTGTPKGVVTSHRGWTNWINYFHEHDREYKIDNTSHVFPSAPHIFDCSFWERWLAYGLGGTVYINRDHEQRDARSLKQFFNANKITIGTFTPSFLALLDPYDFPTLKCIFVVGEALSIELIKKWKDAIPGLVFVNGYGPTESTAGVTLFICQENESVLIGKPIDNMTVYVLDHKKQLVPAGVYGELYIGGVGVAKEYFEAPQKTREAFIADTFSNQKRARLYRTGDKGRHRADGNLEFKGRINNNQVKLHGVRIELEEIENLLASHPNINHASVKIWDNKFLAAYIQTNNNVTLKAAELRSFLIEKGLATIKIPTSFTTIEKIPLTKTGKLDKASLPRPIQVEAESLELMELPQTKTEFALLKIWQELFPFKEISTHYDFREIGGDSFIIVRLLNKINETLFDSNTSFGLPNFPDKFNIKTLGTVIDSLKVNNHPSLHISDSMQDLYQGVYNQLMSP